MKVLHINTLDTGGAFQAAYRLHEELLNQSIDSTDSMPRRLELAKSMRSPSQVWRQLIAAHPLTLVMPSLSLERLRQVSNQLSMLDL